MVATNERQDDEIHCVICWSLDHGLWLAHCLRLGQDGRAATISQAMEEMVEGVEKIARLRQNELWCLPLERL